LVKELKANGLPGTRGDGSPLTNDDLKPLPVNAGRVVRILNNGDY
jgi:hypothetical protein